MENTRRAINCEINLILTWSENCVLTSKATRDAVPPQGGNLAVTRVNNQTNAIYVPAVTLWTKNDNFLEQLKSGFKRNIKWNKYRSEITNQTKTNHLNNLIDATFTKVNRLFYRSKMKKTEHLFQSIMYQKLK